MCNIYIKFNDICVLKKRTKRLILNFQSKIFFAEMQFIFAFIHHFRVKKEVFASRKHKKTVKFTD